MGDAAIAPLLATACAEPVRNEPRRRLAAWLDERGHPLGRFMRLQLDRHDREASSFVAHPRPEAEERFGADAARRAWCELAPALAALAGRRDGTGFELVRGMAGAAKVTWDDLRESAWLAAAPLEHLDVIGKMPAGGLARLLDLPGRAWLRSLSLEDVGLDEESAVAIAGAEWPHLRWIALGRNRIGESGAEAFVASRTMPRLILADFAYNFSSPCEVGLDARDLGEIGPDWFASPFPGRARVGERTDHIMEKVFSENAEALWDQHGRPSWPRVLWRRKSERPHRHNVWDGLADVDLGNEDMSGAVLLGGRLERVRAERSRWRSANLAASVIEDCDFGRADLRDVSVARATLRRTRFSRAAARRLDFTGAQLSECDFGGADLSEAVFEDAVVADCSFRDARMGCHDRITHMGRTRRTRFVRCDFRGADVDGREMVDVEMHECTFDGARGTLRHFGSTP